MILILKVTGNKVKCMVWVHLDGKMEVAIVENINMVGNMELELLFFEEVRSIKGNGCMGNNMEKERLVILMGILSVEEHGKKGFL